MRPIRNNILPLVLLLIVLLAAGVSVQAQNPTGTMGADLKPGRPGSNAKGQVSAPSKLPIKPSALNPKTLRLMEMIEKKNRELKTREAELLLREKNLESLEQKVRADLKKIEPPRSRSA